MKSCPPFHIRQMLPADVTDVVKLQRLAFPPPFSEDLHWDEDHIRCHLEVFPAGQFVAVMDDIVVGSCSNAIIGEAKWQEHGNWGRTVGGPYIRNHILDGSTLYGLDITVTPAVRRIGIGRAFYSERFQYVRSTGLTRYGTGCRLPDYRTANESEGPLSIADYASGVVSGRFTDRTLSPLLRYGLTFLGVLSDYMEDIESGNAAALLEWTP